MDTLSEYKRGRGPSRSISEAGFAPVGFSKVGRKKLADGSNTVRGYTLS